MAGVGPGGWLQRTLTVFKVGAIALLIAVGLMLGNGDWGNLIVTAPQVGSRVEPWFVSLIFALYAYSGWNAAAYLAGEIVDPGRTIPRTMNGGTLFVALLYIVLNGFYFYALPVTVLAQPPLLPVAHKVASALLGLDAGRSVTALLCLSIAGGVSAMVWAGPRVYYAMAKDGLIPSVFGNTATTHGTPINAILLQSLWASVLIVTGSFEQLVIYSGTVVVIFSALAVAAVVVLRRHQPDLPRPYHTPYYPFVPGFFVLASTLIVGTALYERPLEGGLGVATVLAGTPMYLLWQRFRVQGSTPMSSKGRVLRPR